MPPLEYSTGCATINKLSFMKLLILLSLYLLGGCATKYIVPGNRFITPESQGGTFHGQIEIQQTTANQLTIDTSNNSVDEGVTYASTTRTGFLFSDSIFDSFDFIWSHTGSANSLLGGKLQVIGDPRLAKATGHKMSVAALFGNNEHETDDRSVEFELGAREFFLIYGYRVSENVLPYLGFSRAAYDFSGKIKSSNTALNGLEPHLKTTTNSLNMGIEFSMNSLFGKLEATYQQLSTTDTKDRDRFMFGYSVGYSW